ncbi:MAG: cytidylate kinase-like family protein, partial [Nanoarchaeota archaeon]|nr:cytidylate kinase-like family protein [Nanoarchaeota archaeon]
KNLFFSKISRKSSIKMDERKNKPIVTISREFGSGGSIIAEKVAKQLGKKWKAYHSEIVNKIAKDANLEKKVINEIDEADNPIINQIIEDFFGKKYINLNNYSKHLVKIISAIAVKGYAVIVGRGSNFLIPNSLKIRIIADMENRIKTVMQFRKVKRSTAESMIESSDKKRTEFTKQLFNHASRNAYHYDAVIKTGGLLNNDDIVDVIVHLAKRKFNL